MSVVPPAAKGTTMRTGLLGQAACAEAQQRQRQAEQGDEKRGGRRRASSRGPPVETALAPTAEQRVQQDRAEGRGADAAQRELAPAELQREVAGAQHQRDGGDDQVAVVAKSPPGCRPRSWRRPPRSGRTPRCSRRPSPAAEWPGSARRTWARSPARSRSARRPRTRRSNRSWWPPSRRCSRRRWSRRCRRRCPTTMVAMPSPMKARPM